MANKIYLSLLGISISFNLFANPGPQAFQLIDASIASVHQAMQDHQLTCVELVNDYLTRIKTYDLDLSRGAPINAFVNINPSVLEEAQALDKTYTETGEFIGPLHCIPVIIKDNIDMIESPSSSGSLSLLGSQPVKDAVLVTQLRHAGAIILGHGTMDEFASGMSGISSRSGRVGNTYDPTQNPGGSSSGVATAVSANFAMVGIGTDNSGSVRIPAAFNGVYGLRPSTGLISQSGIFPRGNLDGVAGPIARNVEDLATVLSVISINPTSYNSFLNANALVGKRIGIVTEAAKINPFPPQNSESNTLYQNSFKRLQSLGATLVNVNLPNFDNNRDNNMAGEVDNINAYLASFPSTRQNFMDICSSERSIIFTSISNCKQHIQKTGYPDGKSYQQAIALFQKNRNYVENVMTINHLDALVIPLTTSGYASYDVNNVNTSRIALSSNSGLPALTFIAGYNHAGMPVSLELIGKMNNEGELMGMVYAYAQKMGTRPLPDISGPSNLNLNDLSIPALNNLFTLIGNQAYVDVLKKGKSTDLTPQKFNKIVREVVNAYNSNKKI